MCLRDKIHRHIRYTNAIVDKFFFLNIQVFAFAYGIITSIAFWISFFILQLLFYRKSRYAPSGTLFSIFRLKELINHFSSVIIYIFVDTTITIIISNFQQSFPKGNRDRRIRLAYISSSTQNNRLNKRFTVSNRASHESQNARTKCNSPCCCIGPRHRFFYFVPERISRIRLPLSTPLFLNLELLHALLAVS